MRGKRGDSWSEGEMSSWSEGEMSSWSEGETRG